MKKSGVIAVLVIVVLLTSVVSSVSLVSAGWFGEVWNKITGRAVEENTTSSTLESEPVPLKPLPPEIVCEEGTKQCPDGFFVSRNPDNNCEFYPCPSVQECADKEGRCGGSCPPCPTARCKEGETKNYVCPDGTEVFACKCENGNWVCIISPENACPKEKIEPVETEPEIPSEKCAAEIKITTDKEIYYYGNYAEVLVEIFDSQGNHLSNYPFVIQVYTSSDGLWHSVDSGITDGEGYRKSKDKIEEGRQPAGRLNLKVYTLDTKEYVNCASVENIVEIEIKKGEKEEVCGIGVCVPEEAKEVKQIPEEKILYSCGGCELEDKCYPIGYRKEGKYCGIDYEFIVQLETGACENSFECKSNVCISDECVSESLMKRIINWFKKLFGVKPEPEAEPEELELEKCSELLIEKDIGDYKYNQSRYGEGKDGQAPLYSKDGKQIGVVKCCGVLYDGGMAALVCPYDNREDLENSLKWLSARGELTLGEYNGQKVYNLIGKKVIVWANDKYVIGVGTETDSLSPENIINVYLKKYPNNLAEFLEKIGETPIETIPVKEIAEEPISQPPSGVTEEFLDKIKGLGEVTLIDFETLPDGTILQNGDRLTGKEWENSGVVFETPSEEYLKVFGPMYPFNPIDKLSLSPGFGPFESGSDTDDDLTIKFSEPVKAAGIYLLDLGGTDERESITFLDENNNILEKISPWPKSTFGNPAPGTFVGLVHDGISKIEILENTQDGDDIAYDNLYFVK